ncbi:MAG: exodeoxyribonuclease V subunit alpha [Candidatus Tectimicrobiota bacterium]
MWGYLETLRQREQLSDLDLHFGRLLARLAASEAPPFLMAACLTSHWTSQGHVCLDLNTLAGQVLFAQCGEPWIAPELASWTSTLLSSAVVGRPGDFCPLVLDARGRLYLYRYWHYEQQLASDLQQRAAAETVALDEERLRDSLARLFPARPAPECDWQKIAAVVAVLKRFCVIAGGPGTGKTRTVARVLALLIEQAGGQPLRISLAAPTGKAAARLQEAVRDARHQLPVEAAIRDAIPTEASTLHRLLGARPDTPTFRHNHEHPLPLDVLVIDEASMVDLALMARMVQALPRQARLILLGDHAQLASVETGAVLGDLCWAAPALSAPFRARIAHLTGESLPSTPASASAIGDAVLLLRQSYRFGHESGIGVLAQAVHRGDTATALHLLQACHSADLIWTPVPALTECHIHLEASLRTGFRPYLEKIKACATPAEAFAAFERFRVLCAHRSGPGGALALNDHIEGILQTARLIDARHAWYPGRPVMITRNDYHLRLFNGDIGITLPDPETDGRLRVYFPAADGSMRGLSPVRLPAHETVYAMTVHKSQGSEFDEVLLVLGEAHSPVMTRELLYTGITRARARVHVCGAAEAFTAAVGRQLQRASGLREALWGEMGQ